jgi:RNA polymerase sigma-70 factor (ECF subfamily)
MPLTFSEEALCAEIPHLHRYARVLCYRSTVDADDLVQECLARALDKQNLWRPGTNLGGWLMTILHNLYVNHVRHNSKRRDIWLNLSEAIDIRVGTPSTQELSLVLADIVRSIDRPPAKLQRAVKLEFHHNYDEIALIENIPLGTAKSRLSRGRESLRRLTRAD